MSSRPPIPTTLRVIGGVICISAILYAASAATRNCTVGLYVYDNCLWTSFREFLGLPASKFLRAGFLEVIGLALAAGLYATFRYVFPPWRSFSVASKALTGDSTGGSKSD